MIPHNQAFLYGDCVNLTARGWKTNKLFVLAVSCKDINLIQAINVVIQVYSLFHHDNVDHCTEIIEKKRYVLTSTKL